MPQAEVRSKTWRRVGAETQEAEGHRVHAQKDIEQGWVFVAVRKGDGIHPCKILGQHAKAADARAMCEADVYDFHWPEQTVELMDKIRGDGTTIFQRMEQRSWDKDRQAFERRMKSAVSAQERAEKAKKARAEKAKKKAVKKSRGKGMES